MVCSRHKYSTTKAALGMIIQGLFCFISCNSIRTVSALSGIQCVPYRQRQAQSLPQVPEKIGLQRSSRLQPLISFRSSFLYSTDQSRLSWEEQLQEAAAAASEEDAYDMDGDGSDGIVETKNSMFGGVDDDDDQNPIPSMGVSVSDEMERSAKERFVTTVVPIRDVPGVAQLVTSPLVDLESGESTLQYASLEPIRYLVPLTKTATANTTPAADTTAIVNYVMIDVPPYSPELVQSMQAFMSSQTTVSKQQTTKPQTKQPLTVARLAALLLTSRTGIHYDDAAALYSARRADLALWKQAFPDMTVIGYRLDVPRDCRPYITQILDGYGPFAADYPAKADAEVADAQKETFELTFAETGRPLTVVEWDHDVAQQVMSGKVPVPDDDENNLDEDDDYSPKGIRRREQGKAILALYTPGHTFGSLSFVFPQSKLVFSGFTIPVEDPRNDNDGNGGDVDSTTGPALDCRGYITTNQAGIRRQMESARYLIQKYSDRFNVVLPSRGDPLFLDDDDITPLQRAHILNSIVDQYEKIGMIYEQLGITSNDAAAGDGKEGSPFSP